MGRYVLGRYGLCSRCGVYQKVALDVRLSWLRWRGWVVPRYACRFKRLPSNFVGEFLRDRLKASFDSLGWIQVYVFVPSTASLDQRPVCSSTPTTILCPRLDPRNFSTIVFPPYRVEWKYPSPPPLTFSGWPDYIDSKVKKNSPPDLLDFPPQVD